MERNESMAIKSAIIQLAKRAWRLPQSAVIAVRQWRQTALNYPEAERLDRIRNPSKYLGKPNTTDAPEGAE